MNSDISTISKKAIDESLHLEILSYGNEKIPEAKTVERLIQKLFEIFEQSNKNANNKEVKSFSMKFINLTAGLYHFKPADYSILKKTRKREKDNMESTISI